MMAVNINLKQQIRFLNIEMTIAVPRWVLKYAIGINLRIQLDPVPQSPNNIAEVIFLVI